METRLIGIAVLCAACAAAQWTQPYEIDKGQPDADAATYRAALRQFCPAPAVMNEAKLECDTCPQGTTDAGLKHGARLQSVITGHFSGPRNDDMLAVLYGCESHAAHFINTFLLTRQGTGKWSSKQVYGPFGSCRLVTNRAGRDGLLCYGSDVYSGSGGGLLTFGYVGEDPVPLLETRIVMSPCSPMYGLDNVVQASIAGVRFGTLPNSETMLTIKASCSRGRKVCRGDDDLTKYAERNYEITFEFDGNTFHVAKASAAALKDYQQCVK